MKNRLNRTYEQLQEAIGLVEVIAICSLVLSAVAIAVAILK